MTLPIMGALYICNTTEYTVTGYGAVVRVVPEEMCPWQNRPARGIAAKPHVYVMLVTPGKAGHSKHIGEVYPIDWEILRAEPVTPPIAITTTHWSIGRRLKKGAQ